MVQTDPQIGNSVLLPEYMDYFHLLPRLIDDGPTGVNFKDRKIPQVSLMDWQCLNLVQAAGPAGLSFLSRRLKLASMNIYWNSSDFMD